MVDSVTQPSFLSESCATKMENVLKIKFKSLLLFLFTSLNIATAAELPGLSGDQIKEIETQIQDVKLEAVDISTGIARLEEKLNFPDSTQISIFLSIAKGEPFILEEVDLMIDGKQVTSHSYSQRELESLQRGGIQRIYTGNIVSGEHTLEVSAMGQSIKNKGYRQNVKFKFSKIDNTKLIALTLAGPDFGNQGVIFRNN